MRALIELVLRCFTQVLIASCALLACVAPCGAQVDTQIEWRAPSRCPSAEVVRARVAALLSSQASATQLRASGAIAPLASDGYVLTLAVNVNGHSAQRSLRASDCAALSEAGAWLIALAVDPTLVNAGAADAEQAAAKPAVPNAAGADAARKTAESTQAAPQAPATADVDDDIAPKPITLATRLGLFGGVYSLGLPAAVLGLGLRAGVGFAGIYTELGLGYLFARTSALPDAASATFSSQFVRLRGCMEWGTRLRILPCAALSLLRTAGDVDGIAQPTQDQALWLTAGAAAQLAFMVRAPFELMLDGGVDLPVTARPRFEIESLGTVATGNFVSVHTTLGVGVRY